MDKKDEKILAELLKNSRMPFNQLGRKVGLSREVVAYRIRKLVEQNIIAHFYPIINLEKLGYFRNGCGIQLKGISLAEEKEFFSFITNHPFVTYVGVVVGKWNVAFDILSRDKNHLKSIIKEILQEGRRHIKNYLVTNSSTEQEIYPAKIIGASDRKIRPKDMSLVKLNAIDKKILHLLSEDARADYVELSSKTHLSANAVKYRIKHLEKLGVIEGYTISIDATKLGYELYNLQLKLDVELADEVLKSFLRAHPRVFYFYKYLGHEQWDVDVGVIAKNSHDLRTILLEFRNELGVRMEIHDIYTNVEILKGDVAPQGIFLDT